MNQMATRLSTIRELGDDGIASTDIAPRLFLKTFTPQQFPAYYRRSYAPEDLLEEIGIWRIAEMVQQGWSTNKIAKLCDISLYSLRRWLRDPDKELVMQEARMMAGENYAYKAEATIRAAQTDFELKKADRLATHYRWLAERLNRKDFGQQVKVEATQSVGVSFSFDLGATRGKALPVGEDEEIIDVVPDMPLPPLASKERRPTPPPVKVTNNLDASLLHFDLDMSDILGAD